MSINKKIVVRTRGIIFDEGELLVVKHSHVHNYYALPGGHLEYGETVLGCIEREIKEELGIRPEIGRLLYVHDFIDKKEEIQSVEFFFEIINAHDYRNIYGLERTHAYEIVDYIWAKKTGEEIILPDIIGRDFKQNKIISDKVQYINDIN